jgi:hypothetical protein
VTARERIADARIARRGFQREAHANEWSRHLRALKRSAGRELHRANGVAKVFSEILAYLAAGLTVCDARALSTIAEQLGIRDRRHVRRCVAWLARNGWIVRVHHRGMRFEGQRGWTTNVYVVPRTFGLVPFMPDAFRDRAIARLRELRGAIGELPELVALLGPAPVENAAPQADRPAENRVDPPDMGSVPSSLSVSSSSTVTLVSPSYLPHESDGCGEPAAYSGEEGAVAPIPPIADEPRPDPAPRARQERTEAVSGGAAAAPDAAAPSEAQPNTGRDRPPTLRELRDRYYATGRYRSLGTATRAAAGALRTFARRRYQVDGSDPGRRPRWRGAAREAERMRRERELAGEPPDSGGE